MDVMPPGEAGPDMGGGSDGKGLGGGGGPPGRGRRRLQQYHTQAVYANMTQR